MSDLSSRYSLSLSDPSNRRLVAAMLIFSGFMAWVATELSWLWAATPLLALIGLVSLMWPRVGVLVLITTMYLRVNLPFHDGAYPADIMTLIVIAGVVANRLVQGERPFARSWVNPIALVVLMALGISITQAYDTTGSIVNWLRHVQLFTLLLAVASGTDDSDARLFIRWMLTMTALIALVNIIQFVAARGSMRVFGLPGPFFALYAALACVHCAVAFVTSDRRRHGLLWGALFLLYLVALMATQTRAALLQAMLGMLFLIGVTWFWARRHGQHQLVRRIGVSVVTVAIIVVILVTGLIPVLENPLDRIKSALEGRSPTIAYRLFLWRTGIYAFLDSPVFGQGLAQVRKWDEFFTQYRFDPLAFHTRGLSAHNDLITYLAETGLVGTLAMLWLFWRILATGRHAVVRAASKSEFVRIMQIWTPAVTIIIGYFFSTHMFYSLAGMMTAIYFGMWVRFTERQSSDATPLA